MVKDTHTRAIPIRIPKPDWEKFEQTAGPGKRSAVVNQFIRWYNREPGVEFPERPPAKALEEHGDA